MRVTWWTGPARVESYSPISRRRPKPFRFACHRRCWPISRSWPTSATSPISLRSRFIWPNASPAKPLGTRGLTSRRSRRAELGDGALATESRQAGYIKASSLLLCRGSRWREAPPVRLVESAKSSSVKIQDAGTEAVCSWSSIGSSSSLSTRRMTASWPTASSGSPGALAAAGALAHDARCWSARLQPVTHGSKSIFNNCLDVSGHSFSGKAPGV